MSEWRECTLKDLVLFQRGHDLPKTEMQIGNIPVAGSNGIIGYHNVATTKGPGITIGRSGNIGTPHFYKDEFWAHNTVLYVKDFNGNDEKFAFYFLNIMDLSGFNAGSAVPTLNRNHIHELIVKIPPLPEQKAIAGVLSSLDDKIYLLHRQNKTLEAMADALFRQWFVEEADEGWKEIKLGNVVEVKRGGSPRPIQDYLSETGYRWLKISDATKENSPFIFDINEHIKPEGLNKTTYLEAGKLVLSNSATPGIPKILQVDTCIHDGWLHFPKSKFSNEFLYLFFKGIRQELENMGNGSIFTNLKTDILKEFTLKLPEKIILDNFQIKVMPIFDRLLSNTKQIRILEKLRDSLLLKLMSGEVKIKGV